MTPERKVVVITGASRGIGAQLSKAYRHIGYQVIASSRSMRERDDPAILVIEGDITRPETAERILGIAAERFGRIDTLVNNAGFFIAKPFTEYSVRDFSNDDRGKSRGILSFVAEGRSFDAADGLGPHRQHHRNDCRTADGIIGGRACGADQRRAQRDHALARDRICQPSRSRERRLAGRDQDADAFAGGARLSQRVAADGPNG